MTRPIPYLQPLTIRGRVARPQPKGLPVINLGFNELPYPPSPAVAAALAARAGRLGSYGSPRCDALRAKLAALHAIGADQIICGNGSEELIDVIARNFLRPGDEMVISEYGYIQFEMTAHRLGASLRKAPECDLVTDIDAILAAIGPTTRIVFLANPNNPTGTMVPASEIARLSAGLPPNVVLVLDLAYGDFVGAPYCAAMHQLAARAANVVVLRTFSKAYGLAGTRIGWAQAPEWMLPGFYAARGMGSVNGLAQAAAVAGLSEQDVVDARIAEIVGERDRIRAALLQMGFKVPESAANFLLAAPPDATPERAEAICEGLYDAGGFVVNKTREAGLEAYFRFSLSRPEHNDDFLEVLRGLA